MLQNEVAKIGREAGAETVAVACYDYATQTSWGYRGDEWFHAASTIKVAVLVGLFSAAEEGRFSLDAPLHVRNRFLSKADGEPYRIASGRDANDEVHAAIGKTMKLRELAYHMIVTSSNLATNLLVDLVGVDYVHQVLEHLQVEGISLKRGVEDEKAFEANINNSVTARGLMKLFRLICEERAFSSEASQEMLGILRQQRFNSGIPAGLPEEVRQQSEFAHKTGEISSVAHDAGLVYIGDRAPYVLVILTSWPAETSPRKETVADISRVVYSYLVEEEDEEA